MINLNVKGMHCHSCKILITDVLEEIGATKIKITVDEKQKVGKVSFEHPDKKKVISAIEAEGYKI
jgi:copper chaperone CopZ